VGPCAPGAKARPKHAPIVRFAYMNLTLRHKIAAIGPRQKIAAALAAAAVLGGGSAVVMAATDGHHGPRHRGAAARAHGAVSAAARYLGLSPQELRRRLRSGQSLGQVANAAGGRSAAGLIEAMVAARAARLKAAVAAGRLSPASAAVRASHLSQRVTRRVDARGRAGGPAAGAHRPGLSAAAAYLGISRAKLKSALRQGRTLAQVASATPGRSAAGLVAALTAAHTAALDAAVAAGTMSATREHQLLRHLGQRVAVEVARSSRAHRAHNT
jgi:hypothetical protein